MKKLLTLFFVSILCLLNFSSLYAQTGDTVFVQTFTWNDPSPQGFGAPYRGSFEFPSDSNRWEKILMYHKLKCDPSTAQDQYNCGEWDYLTYTYITDSAGVFDSTYMSWPRFRLITGTAPDSISYTNAPTWDYTHDWQQYAVITGVLAMDSSIIGTGTTPATETFPTQSVTGRAQYIWRATELSANGMTAGDISGVRLDVDALGSEIRNLSIRMKNSPLDSLFSDNFESGFTDVFRLNTTFSAAGWHRFDFVQPFAWDGTSSIVIEFTYENLDPGTDNSLRTDNAGAGIGVHTSGSPYYIDLSGSAQYANMGSGSQISGNNPRTIEGWAYARSFNGGGLFQAGATGTTGADFSFRTMGSDDLWRFQMWGTPDFDVTLTGSKNSWHHYAVTFDGTYAKVYFDGQFIQQKAVNINTPAHDFWLGRWSGSYFDGSIDEVRVWDVALDAATIAGWQNRSIDASHPNFANLVAYFPLEEGSGTQTAGIGPSGFTGSLLGGGSWGRFPAESYSFNMQETQLRPNILLDQSVYTSTVDSTLSVDSVQNAPVQLVLFDNPSGPYIIPHNAPNQPDEPTDTLLVWYANNYSSIFDTSGNLIDSLYNVADTTLYRNDHEYYSNIVRYEIGRYITPYGINLDLGPDGWTWVYDVTDYAPILHGWKHLQAGNNQELLDLEFAFIKGTPPRDALKVEKLWYGSWSYQSIWDDVNARPVSKPLDPTKFDYRVRTRASGHGFSNPTNCAEFCPKWHYVDVNGSPAFSWYNWMECADNSLQPQGGTWIYDRAGWCPGAKVLTNDFELNPALSGTGPATIDYRIQDPGALGAYGNYVISGQLITYSKPNHTLDAAMLDILSPNREKTKGHFNPICNGPKVRIQNRGSETLTSVLITYGVEDGFQPCWYRWQGSLDFMETADVQLPLFNWTGLDQANPVFWAYVGYPNFLTDEYNPNDTLRVPFQIPPQYNNKMVLEVKTNNEGYQNSWDIRDENGSVVKIKLALGNNVTYFDTLDLPDGCYVFHFKDSGQDGISFFANPSGGNGWMRIHNPQGGFHKVFNPDFGKEVIHHFTIGYNLGTEIPDAICNNTTANDPGSTIDLPEKADMKVYPNPAAGSFYVDINLPSTSIVKIQVMNAMGQVLYTQQYNELRKTTVEVPALFPPGVYMVRVSTPQLSISRPLVIAR